MADDETTVVVKDEMGCAFCDGVVTVGKETESGSAYLFHTTPMCDNFEQMPAEEFLIACRKKRSSN